MPRNSTRGSTRAPPRGSRPAQHEDEAHWIPMLHRGCCCSLDLCCKVQAILVAVTSLMSTPVMLAEYFRCQPYQIDGLEYMAPNCSRYYDDHSRDAANGASGASGVPPQQAKAKFAELALRILLQTIALVAALAFLVGIQRRRPKWLLPYIRVLAVHIIFSIVGLVVMYASDRVWTEAMTLVGLPVGVMLPLYMWLCAYSLYRKMKRETAAPPRLGFDVECGVPDTAMPTTAIRVFAAPPGVVLPPGYGFAPPDSSAVVSPLDAAQAAGLSVQGLRGAPGVPLAMYKPEDLPPPPYESVVGHKPPSESAGRGGAGGAPSPV